MGNRSGKRLSNAEKKANRVIRETKKKQKIIRRNSVRSRPIRDGYFEIYTVLKDHIRDFLRERKQPREKWKTVYSDQQFYRSVIAVVGYKYMYDVENINFEGDDKVTIVIKVMGFADNRSIRPYLTECVEVLQITRSINDPNLMPDIDVLLDKSYQIYHDHEYSSSSNN